MGLSAGFFDTVRPLFGGTLKQHQVEGLTKIVEYGLEWRYPKEHIAYVLATAFHETAHWMQPIREGARRFGPDYSDAAARRAVAAIHAKGIIRTNYALPAGPHGQSYYGRGLVQITWLANYEKFSEILGAPLVEQPDLVLDWPFALDIIYLGMRDGVFTGKKMADYDMPGDFKAARAIVNGDVRKNGGMIADQARVFLKALEA